jgi:hypothetical protein
LCSGRVSFIYFCSFKELNKNKTGNERELKIITKIEHWLLPRKVKAGFTVAINYIETYLLSIGLDVAITSIITTNMVNSLDINGFFQNLAIFTTQFPPSSSPQNRTPFFFFFLNQHLQLAPNRRQTIRENKKPPPVKTPF